MKKVFSKEVKIGIAFIVCIAVLYSGINFLKGINVFKPKNSYVVVFDDVRDLAGSSPVLINGFKVGLVYTMHLIKDSKVSATINLNEGIKIAKGSKVMLDVSMLGNSAIIIENNPSTKEYYSTSDTIYGNKTPNLMKNVADSLLPQISNIVPKVDSIMTNLQNVVANPALIKSVENLQIITENLIQSTQQMNAMMADLKKQMPTLMESAQKTLTNVDGVTKQLNGMNLTSTFNSLDSSMKNIQYMTNKLTMKDNSLGLLMNDRQLYDSLNTTIGNASTLLRDVKQNPRRYINVKVF